MNPDATPAPVRPAAASRGALTATDLGSGRPGDPPRQPLVLALIRVAPFLILAVFALTVALIVVAAGDTLGYDSDAYFGAARNVLDGRPLYDPSLVYAVGHAVFLYPPPFAIAAIPFALLPLAVATWTWLALIVAALLGAIALMPVRGSVRWTVLLLAAVSWPTLYSIKLGQVGPLLLLAFVVAWRSLDRPMRLGAAMAAGALIKVQPAVLFGWALATRRWRSAAIGLAVVAVAVVVSAAVVGPSALVDYLRVLLAISKPVTTPQNVTLGAVAYQGGVPEGTATVLQVALMAGTLAVAAIAWIRADGEVSFVVSVVASQLISPVLWSHYAVILLLPTAFLLQRRQWWAALIPLAGWLPAIVVPLTFLVALLAPLVVGRRSSSAPSGRAASQPRTV